MQDDIKPVLTDAQILAVGTFGQSPLKRLDHGRAIEREVLRVLADREGRQQWIDVRDRLPEPDEPVLVHNGRWTGVGAWMSGEYLEPIERWQGEHREFIEMSGPSVTHWQPLPAPPADAQRAKEE
ncbi:DUF551 domain-containing protein [Orrella sp. JC864]|uniref:DUF551 domain-containing protein n=1 Tax=Orrella sp. JC864 TaxID=3120298 RepID=UPI00300B3A97